MRSGIQIVESIAVCKLQDIIQFQVGVDNRLILQATQWTVLPMNPASGDFSVVSRQDAAGHTFTSSITARLKAEFNVSGHSIVRLKLCSGEELVIGTPDVPVQISNNTTLSLKMINISHTGTAPPLTI